MFLCTCVVCMYVIIELAILYYHIANRSEEDLEIKPCCAQFLFPIIYLDWITSFQIFYLSLVAVCINRIYACTFLYIYIPITICNYILYMSI